MKNNKTKIGLVEDEKNLQDLYRMKLESEGFDVVTASNGEEGYDMVKANQFDLLLIDLIMPKVDGYHLLHRLKRDKITERLPVIVFSNLNQSEEVEKGFKLGARDYILKTSLTPKELSDKVRDFLHKYAHHES